MKCAFLARIALSAVAAFGHGMDARGDVSATALPVGALPAPPGNGSGNETVLTGEGEPEPLVAAPEEVAWHTRAHGWTVTPASDNSAAGGRLRPLFDDSFPVLYVDGHPRTETMRRIVTGKLLLRLREGVDPGGLARDFACADLGSPVYAPPFRLFRAAQPKRAVRLLASIRADPRVMSADLVLARLRIERSLPNDPFFPQQWYLRNLGPNNAPEGVDVHVEPLWGDFGGEGTRGQGVRIGLIDDGIEAAHPEFAGRLDTLNDHNWNDGGADDGEPGSSEDRHGTAVAGFTGANGNNLAGICGVAPEATLISLRLIAGPADDQDEAEAFHWGSDRNSTAPIHIKNSSWGPPDEALLLNGPGPLAKAALAAATAPETGGRGGHGTLFVFSVGNGAEFFENSNHDGYANDIHVIAVGAVSDSGNFASYSEPGANVCVCAPSYAGLGSRKMLTTDRLGPEGFNPSPTPREDVEDHDFTTNFGGTSAAAPLVSGICALMLQTNPNLGWRDVKEILMRTARKIDETNAGWQTNSAGFHFHHRYGAGLVDATAACEMARTWINLPPAHDIQLTNISVGPIPDNDPRGIVRTFQVMGARRLEHVTLKLRATHAMRGDLRVTLTSPSGTTSVLTESFYDPFAHADYKDWTFSSVQMWGEPANGIWTLRVGDEAPQDVGTFQGAWLGIHFSDLGPPPTITSAPEGRAIVGQFFTHTVTASNANYNVQTQGPLPPGLAFDPASRILSGIPEQRGLFAIVFKVWANNALSTQNFSLRVLSRYEQWLADFGLPSATTAYDDPDRDSLTNLAEYATGSDPTVPSSPAITLAERDSTNGNLTFKFVRLPARDDVDYLVEISPDLRNWTLAARSIRGDVSTPLSPRFSVAELATVDGPIEVSVSDTAGIRQAWFRLRFVLPP